MDTLVRQIYASQLDYAEINERAEVLRLKADKTVDDKRILADYEKKLKHDRDLVKEWIKLAGSKLTPENHKVVMAELQQTESVELDKIHEKIAEQNDLFNAQNVEYKDYRKSVDDLLDNITERQNRMSIIQSLGHDFWDKV